MLLIKQGRQESLQTGRAHAQWAYIKQQDVQARRQLMQELNAEWMEMQMWSNPNKLKSCIRNKSRANH